MNKKGGDSKMIGKILECSWGYSMTIVDFYIVIKETNKTLTIQEIGRKDTVSTGFLSGTVMPDPDKKLENIQRVVKRIGTDGKTFYKGSLGRQMMHWLDEWDGKPAYFNHCD